MQDRANVDMYALNLELFQWRLTKPKPMDGDTKNWPGSLEEHAAVKYNDSIYIFGGS